MRECDILTGGFSQNRGCVGERDKLHLHPEKSGRRCLGGAHAILTVALLCWISRDDSIFYERANTYGDEEREKEREREREREGGRERRRTGSGDGTTEV